MSDPVTAAAGASPAWHALSTEEALAAQRVEPVKGLTSAEVEARRAKFGSNEFTAQETESRWHAFLRQYADAMQIVLLVAGLLSIYPVKQVPTGVMLIRADGPQRLPGPQPGGQGRRRGGGAPEDDGRQGTGAAGRGAAGDPGRGARARRRRLVRGRRPRDRGRTDHLGGDARDRRGGAHRREPPVLQAGRRRRRGRAARRPPRHGLHEHQRHPRVGPDGRRRDRDDHRGRPHLRDAPGGRGPGDAPHPPDQHPDQPAAGHRRARAAGVDLDRLLPARRVVRHAVRDRDRVRRVRHPQRPAGGHHDDPLVRDPAAGQGARDREAAAIRGDAGLDVGDQLRQDGHPDAQPDDGRRDGDPRPALHDQRDRLRDRRHHRAGRRRHRRAARRVPAPVRAGRRRGGEGGRPHRRSHRGRAGRARREGRGLRDRHARGVPARRDPPVRRRLQDDGHLPRDEGRARPRRHPRLRQGRPRPAARPRHDRDHAGPVRRHARRRRDEAALPRRERAPRVEGPAGHGHGSQGLRSRRPSTPRPTCCRCSTA